LIWSNSKPQAKETLKNPMKKIAIISLLSVASAAAYAQGTVNFFNGAGGKLALIYAPNPASPSIQQLGNSAADSPVGTVVYGGVPIGGSSGGVGINYANGNQFTVQLYAYQVGSGALGQPLSSLTPVTAYISTMNTSGTAGEFISGNLTPDPGINIPNTLSDAQNTATIDNKTTCAVACWYNAGGTITSLAQAIAMGVPQGESAAFNQNNLGEPASIESAADGPGTPPTTAQTLALQSFSLVSTPEPSTIALGLMGAGAFLARRRKK
jgi:hypothetical protein